MPNATRAQRLLAFLTMLAFTFSCASAEAAYIKGGKIYRLAGENEDSSQTNEYVTVISRPDGSLQAVYHDSDFGNRLVIREVRSGQALKIAYWNSMSIRIQQEVRTAKYVPTETAYIPQISKRAEHPGKSPSRSSTSAARTSATPGNGDTTSAGSSAPPSNAIGSTAVTSTPPGNNPPSSALTPTPQGSSMASIADAFAPKSGDTASVAGTSTVQSAASVADASTPQSSAASITSASTDQAPSLDSATDPQSSVATPSTSTATTPADAVVPSTALSVLPPKTVAETAATASAAMNILPTTQTATPDTQSTTTATSTTAPGTTTTSENKRTDNSTSSSGAPSIASLPPVSTEPEQFPATEPFNPVIVPTVPKTDTSSASAALSPVTVQTVPKTSSGASSASASNLTAMVPMVPTVAPPAVKKPVITPVPITGDNFISVSDSPLGPCVWIKFPIKVFVATAPGANGAQLVSEAKDAFTTWTQATGNKIRFEFVPTSTADIVVTWVTSQAGFTNPKEAGEASVDYHTQGKDKKTLKNPGDITHARIRLMVRAINNKEWQPGELRLVALHEIGHSLGLFGHSTNRNDIMYSENGARELSQRDINTVNMLYASVSGE